MTGFHQASYQELLSTHELTCSLSGPHSLLSKSASFMRVCKTPKTRTVSAT